MYRCLACHPVVEVMAYSGYYYYMNSESITRSSKSDRTGIVKEYFQTVNKLADTVKCDRDSAIVKLLPGIRTDGKYAL